MVSGVNSITVGGLSVMTGGQLSQCTAIMFYINLGLVFCALLEATALVILYRKTSCASVIGLSTIILYGMGALMFFIQLLMYVYGNAYAVYLVYFCMALLYSSFIMSCVYCIMLGKKSHKTLCLITGIVSLIPPIGAVLAVVLSYKMQRDTPIQEYIYNGYAYTYAALGQYCAKNKPEFIDAAGEEEPERLDKKQKKRKLKELKRRSSTPEGAYEYAAAIVMYTPENSNKAVKYFKRSAERNHAPALFNLGYFYEIGAYVKKDLKKAKSYYARATEAGDADAALRLGIIEIKSGDKSAGVAMLKDLAENKNDLCAKYDLGICAELGVDAEPDIDKAVDIYCECISAGMFTAQKRVFALAAHDINSAQNGSFFRQVTDRPYEGSFAEMIKGLIEIKKRRAADAAERFLAVVESHDKWEGLARCIVGTLYLDCGKELEDKCNGAEYIKSALDMLPSAKDVYSVVPRSILKELRSKSK